VEKGREGRASWKELLLGVAFSCSVWPGRFFWNVYKASSKNKAV
jgi:hypothetical protein